MQLLLIRHAIAQEREIFAVSGKGDADRPLTPYGRRRMVRNARGLRRVAPVVNLVVASPYARAMETAQIVAETLRVEARVTSDTLTPGRQPKEFFSWLASQSPDSVIAAVGHEPNISLLLQWAIAQTAESHAQFKKGGAALVLFDGVAKAGQGVLAWFVTPSLLRSIGD
jgi:phosphohistidine phosphatase